MASVLQNAKVLVIAGTTAVGKTDLSLELAKRINGEIISADSVQVYRHMDIGSAKVDSKSQTEVPHHLIDVVDIKDSFSSAADYYRLAKPCLEDVISRGKTPIVVGGTYMYIDFLLSGPTTAPPTTDESRTNVDSYLGDVAGDWEKCLEKLRCLDPVYADSLGPNDWFRLKRALDICLQTNRTVTSFKRKEGLPYEFKCLFLTMPRVQLFERIDCRCEQLIKAGLIQETASLMRYHGLKPDTPNGNSIGYRQSMDYLSQEWNYPDKDDSLQEQSNTPSQSMLEKRTAFLKYVYQYQAKTRQFAGNQLVRFKSDSRFQWVNMAPGGERVELCDTADKVRVWFQGDHAQFPSELDGTSLKTLNKDEISLLKIYTASEHERLQIYNNDNEIDNVLEHLTEFIKTLK